MCVCPKNDVHIQYVYESRISIEATNGFCSVNKIIFMHKVFTITHDISLFVRKILNYFTKVCEHIHEQELLECEIFSGVKVNLVQQTQYTCLLSLSFKSLR